MRIDPLLVPVLQRKFKSITEEMALTLLRTTRSPILAEARDFVTGIYDAEGEALEQSDYNPIMGFSLQPSLATVIEYFGDDIAPGDVIFHNDVFGRGNQLNDIGIIRPVFLGDRLIGWAGCKGHQADIGGSISGGYDPRVREVWHEGLRFTPIKVYERGVLRRDLWNFIAANVRLDMVMQDLKAGIGAAAVGERRFVETAKRYGLEVFQAHSRELLDATERSMRSEISRIPEGLYEAESWVMYDGAREGVRTKIKVAVVVDGEEITFDFTGTGAQTPGYVNAPASAAAAATMIGLLMHVNADLPRNAGMARPVHMIFPEGSILNPRFPAATAMGNHLANQILHAVFQALAKACPERATAGWCWTLVDITIATHPATGRKFVDFDFFANKGGSGGTRGADGCDHLGSAMTAGGISGQDPEMYEIQTPNRILMQEYWKDSAGAGQWRGGYGTHSIYRIGGRDASIVTFGAQVSDEERPFGLFGGRPGTLNRIVHTFPDGRLSEPRAHDILLGADGVTVEHWAAGGGGCGDPSLRPAEKVREEVLDELLSVEKAERDYGVEIDPVSLELRGRQKAG
ncbi:MAG: hydantoinase B/oxoprolinase family protein [Betaproteobacteria bacterium]|nr:hydantoinase B/oxoprolinase family protein [Betaproteobacteria bacterium]